jgi:hypothetical protein
MFAPCHWVGGDEQRPLRMRGGGLGDATLQPADEVLSREISKHRLRTKM